jgi:murein DD-endopeptidase MepM/ murein hydrolase activator NlpD
MSGPRWLIAALMVLAVLCARAAAPPLELPRASAVPGGVALIRLPASAAAAPAPSTEGPGEPLGEPVPDVEADGHRVLVLRSGTGWLAVVGIPLTAQPGLRRITLQGSAGAQTLSFRIEPKQYETQALRVAPGQVNLSAADLARAAADRTLILTAVERWSAAAPDRLQFDAPVPGVRSSSFGLRRVFNGEARNPHTGMDIAAPTGTPVLAPAGGRIAAVGDYFFTGNTVLLDHGRGFVSLYCHLSAVDVKPGQEVQPGTRLGAVGMTGRATGPHLHWALSLNATWVDPALFLR